MDVGSIQGYGKVKTYSDGTISSTNAQPADKTPPSLDKQHSIGEIESEIAGINKWLQTTSSHIKFTLHEDLNEYYVQVINDQTNEVIREIPSKKVMDMVAKMHEMIGLLVDEKR
ncbi:flagellar protein FlaG [Brevibacillus borstelensis]|jgi:flagellar protein FlaG|uniref:flagellar protein FlaG n=1 Tax=Brevibacillus borstelensis TaxID=45462 RepID=UPI002E1F3A0F|nr:flagellar protein FlaG [Brevibacillus borstelensis]MED2007473.1 flagellar protein FlaG [Brevibacillus borstelensis]